MADLNKLAEFLLRLALSCETKTTIRRCIHVLRRHSGITSESAVIKNLKLLSEELDKTPIYTVDGVQEKFWLDGNQYKLDGVVGHPYGLVEHIVSRALDYCSFDSAPISNVKYDACTFEGRTGCRCRNYLHPDEHEINFWDVPNSESLQTFCEVGLYKDLAIYFLCDFLFYNTDRHYGNIVVAQGMSTRHLAPVFDMGNSLAFVDEPKYESFIPDPYGTPQLDWAMSVLGIKPVFKFTEFYNGFDHAVQGYSKRIVDEYLERILLCADSKAVQRFWEVV